MGSQAVSAASLFGNNAAAGGKAGQGLQSTFNKSGVEGSEKQQGSDS